MGVIAVCVTAIVLAALAFAAFVRWLADRAEARKAVSDAALAELRDVSARLAQVEGKSRQHEAALSNRLGTRR